MTDPMTPPTELWQQWEEDWHHSKVRHVELEPYIATQAAQWGADQELEACCEWVSQWAPRWPDGTRTEDELRAARRPKPPSLKEDALAALHGIHDQGPTPEQVVTIRRALEALDD